MINSHGTITTANLAQKRADTTRYGPLRIDLSRHVVQVLDQLNLIYALDGGNLVGAYRDGKMLPHDDDFDFVLYTDALSHKVDDQEKDEFLCSLRASIEPLLDVHTSVRVVTTYAKKLEIYRPQYGKYRFCSGQHHPVPFDTDYHNVTCDLTLLLPRTEEPGILQYQHTGSAKHRHNLDDLLPLSSVDYEGHSYNAPASIEGYLTSSYGYLGTDAVYNPETGFYEQANTL